MPPEPPCSRAKLLGTVIVLLIVRPPESTMLPITMVPALVIWVRVLLGTAYPVVTVPPTFIALVVVYGINVRMPDEELIAIVPLKVMLSACSVRLVIVVLPRLLLDTVMPDELAVSTDRL